MLFHIQWEFHRPDGERDPAVAAVFAKWQPPHEATSRASTASPTAAAA